MIKIEITSLFEFLSFIAQFHAFGSISNSTNEPELFYFIMEIKTVDSRELTEIKLLALREFYCFSRVLEKPNFLCASVIINLGNAPFSVFKKSYLHENLMEIVPSYVLAIANNSQKLSIIITSFVENQ